MSAHLRVDSLMSIRHDFHSSFPLPILADRDCRLIVRPLVFPLNLLLRASSIPLPISGANLSGRSLRFSRLQSDLSLARSVRRYILQCLRVPCYSPYWVWDSPSKLWRSMPSLFSNDTPDTHKPLTAFLKNGRGLSCLLLHPFQLNVDRGVSQLTQFFSRYTRFNLT